MPCQECERLERLRDFLSQETAHITTDEIATLGSHDPIFADAVGSMDFDAEKLCDMVASKMEAHNATHRMQESKPAA